MAMLTIERSDRKTIKMRTGFPFLPPFQIRSGINTLRRGLASDAGVVVGVMIFQNLLRIASSMMLTRILNVEAFAVAGIVTSVLVTVALLSDVGIVAFIVRHQDSHKQTFKDEVWTLRLIRGVCLSLVVALLASPIANYMQKPYLAGVIAAAGLYYILDGLGSLAPFTALRNRKVRTITAIDVASQLIGTVVSVVLALIFRSYWALILSNICGQLLSILFSYTLYPESKQTFRFSRARASELWMFSRLITSSTIISLIIMQGDKLVMSRLFPLEVMGLYIIASGLAATPTSLVAGYAGKVLYPVYSEIFRNAPETLRDKFYSVRMTPTLLYAFASGGFIGFSPVLIRLLYDDRYLGAGVYIQILAISSFFAAGTAIANDLMITLGIPRFTFLTNIVRLAYLLIGGTIGWLTMGAIGIIWTVGTVEFAAQIYSWVVLRQMGYLRISLEARVLTVGFIGFVIGIAAAIPSNAALKAFAL